MYLATDVGGALQEADLAKVVDGSPPKKTWLDLAKHNLYLAWSAAYQYEGVLQAQWD